MKKFFILSKGKEDKHKNANDRKITDILENYDYRIGVNINHDFFRSCNEVFCHKERTLFESCAKSKKDSNLAFKRIAYITTEEDFETISSLVVLSKIKEHSFYLHSTERMLIDFFEEKRRTKEWFPKLIPSSPDISMIEAIDYQMSDEFLLNYFEEKIKHMEFWFKNGTIDLNQLDLLYSAMKISLDVINSGDLGIEDTLGISIFRGAFPPIKKYLFYLNPVAIVIDSEYVNGSGKYSRKIKILQYDSEFVNFQNLATQLNKIEKGWFGNSKQIESCEVSTSEIDAVHLVSLVQKNMNKTTIKNKTYISL